MQWETVIGLEIHAQLSTKTKIFSGASTVYGAEPNTQACGIDIALPGVLPVLNVGAVERAIKFGLAVGATINSPSIFARKNYFYPDLPKGYQISQYEIPIVQGGSVTIQIRDIVKVVRLTRAHLEEDAGKSTHSGDYTYLNYNRAGIPLLEIVTEPCIHSAADAFSFLTELRKTVRWLAVCDGNMEEGSMRCDANISIRLKGESALGKRVEVKNLNSIRNVKKAIEIEQERLIALAENNEPVIQETRSFDADRQVTFSLRSKEDADDYRYFPEPDLPPFTISDTFIESVKNNMPVLPEQWKDKFINEYALPAYDATIICNDKDDALFFETLAKLTSNKKAAANWLLGPLKSYCNENNITINRFPLHAEAIVSLIDLTESGQVNFNNASTKILQELMRNPSSTAEAIAVSLNLVQEKNESSIETWVDEVLASMPEKVKEYKSGKKGLIGLFAGEVKKRSKGKADMALVNKLLSEKLQN